MDRFPSDDHAPGQQHDSRSFAARHLGLRPMTTPTTPFRGATRDRARTSVLLAALTFGGSTGCGNEPCTTNAHASTSSSGSSAVDDVSTTGGGSSESTDGEEVIACVPASAPPVGVTMTPTADVLQGAAYSGECFLGSIDTSVASFTCPSDDGIVGLRLTVQNSSSDLSDLAETGDSIRLAYWTTLPSELDPPEQHMTWRRSSDDALLLVAATVTAPNRLPTQVGPLELRVIESTDCAATDGSCGLGIMRRVAIEAALPDGTTTVVFDGNESSIGDYLLQVGTAVLDEGSCDGISENRYVFVATRAP